MTSNATPQAALSVARAYSDLGDVVRLEKAFIRATALMPESPEAWYDLARVQISIGKTNEGMEAFKNAVDSLGPEWVQKTVAFVSYGADNGVRAVEQWRQIIANFQMVDVRAQVSMTIFGEVTADGVNPAERREDEVQNLLDQLIAATARSLS